MWLTLPILKSYEVFQTRRGGWSEDCEPFSDRPQPSEKRLTKRTSHTRDRNTWNAASECKRSRSNSRKTKLKLGTFFHNLSVTSESTYPWDVWEPLINICGGRSSRSSSALTLGTDSVRTVAHTNWQGFVRHLSVCPWQEVSSILLPTWLSSQSWSRYPTARSHIVME